MHLGFKGPIPAAMGLSKEPYCIYFHVISLILVMCQMNFPMSWFVYKFIVGVLRNQAGSHQLTERK